MKKQLFFGDGYCQQEGDVMEKIPFRFTQESAAANINSFGECLDGRYLLPDIEEWLANVLHAEYGIITVPFFSHDVAAQMTAFRVETRPQPFNDMYLYLFDSTDSAEAAYAERRSSLRKITKETDTFVRGYDTGYCDAEGHVYLEKKGNLLIEVDIIEPMGLMTTADMETAHAEFLKRKRKYDAFLRRVQKFEVITG